MVVGWPRKARGCVSRCLLLPTNFHFLKLIWYQMVTYTMQLFGTDTQIWINSFEFVWVRYAIELSSINSSSFPCCATLHILGLIVYLLAGGCVRTSRIKHFSFRLSGAPTICDGACITGFLESGKSSAASRVVFLWCRFVWSKATRPTPNFRPTCKRSLETVFSSCHFWT